MALSDRESRILDELAAQLSGDDPRVARHLTDERRTISGRHISLSILVAVIALALCVPAAIAQLPLVLGAGLVVLTVGLTGLITAAPPVSRRPRGCFRSAWR